MHMELTIIIINTITLLAMEDNYDIIEMLELLETTEQQAENEQLLDEALAGLHIVTLN